MRSRLPSSSLARSATIVAASCALIYLPFQAATLSAASRELLRGSVAVAVVGWLCWGFGRQLDRVLRPTEGRHQLADHGLAVLLGQAGLALAGAILAALGGYRPVTLGIVLALLVPPAIAATRHARLVWPPVEGRAQQLLRASLALVGLATLAGALLPVSWFDSLQYHAALPALYLMEGGKVDLPDNLFSHLPHLWEMHLGFALALDHHAPLGVFAWLDGAAGAAATIGLARRLAPRSEWLAALILVTCWEWSRAATVVGVDLFVGALAAHALLLVLTGRRNNVAMGALLCGLVVAAKIHGLLAAASVGAALLTYPPARRHLRTARFWLSAGAAVLIPFALSLATWRQYGTPYWPFGDSHPEIRAWTVWLVHRVRAEAPDGGDLSRLPGILLARLLAPRGWNPALLLGLSGLPLTARKRAPRLVPLAAFASTFVLGWAAGGRLLRYATPLLPALAAAAAAGAVWIGRRLAATVGKAPLPPAGPPPPRSSAPLCGAAWGPLWTASMTTILMLGSLATARDLDHDTDASRFLSGAISSRALLDLRTPLGPWDAVQWANDTLPPEAYVASLGEPRLFHLWRRWRAATVFDRSPLSGVNAAPPGLGVRTLADLRRRGFTHLLTNEPYARYLATKADLPLQQGVPAGIAAVEGVLAEDRTPEYSGRSAKIWSLSPAP